MILLGSPFFGKLFSIFFQTIEDWIEYYTNWILEYYTIEY